MIESRTIVIQPRAKGYAFAVADNSTVLMSGITPTLAKVEKLAGHFEASVTIHRRTNVRLPAKVESELQSAGWPESPTQLPLHVGAALRAIL